MSYADLSDGDVQGGRLLMFMSSLNWILRPQLKCMFEIGAGRVRATAADGNLFLAQCGWGCIFTERVHVGRGKAGTWTKVQ